MDNHKSWSLWRLNLAMIFIGWICTTTGFSMVLYSRLHLLDATRRWRRALLMMIVAIAIVVHPVTIILETVPGRPDQATHRIAWLTAWSIWHRIRPFIMLISDVIISSLYMKVALEFVRAPQPSRASWLSVKENRQVASLILMQAVVWVLDLAIVACALAKVFIIAELAGSFVYAVKLKLEFVFLTQLVDMSRAARSREDFVLNLGDEQPVFQTVARPALRRHETSEEYMEHAQVAPLKTSTV
jgi:hypothetical protein